MVVHYYIVYIRLTVSAYDLPLFIVEYMTLWTSIFSCFYINDRSLCITWRCVYSIGGMYISCAPFLNSFFVVGVSSLESVDLCKERHVV